MTTLFVLDATGFLFRSYFAIRGMTDEQGRSTNALFGFTRSILKLVKDFHPTHMVAVFDAPDNKASRVKIYPDYKANRETCPEDLPQQLEWAREFCDCFGIPTITAPGVESDDTMATVALWAKDRGMDTLLCTSDKDLFQLVDDRIKILQTHKNNLVIGPPEVEEIFGVSPQQIGDLLAIMGDSSDNIPGLPGFGAKTAAKLLQEFGTLEAILAHPEKVSGKKKQETIREKAHLAELSRELVTLNTAVDLSLSDESLTLRSQSQDRLRDFFMERKFRTLVKELDTEEPNGEENQTPSPLDEQYLLVDDEASLATLLERLSQVPQVCIDTETTDINPMKASLVGVGLAYRPGEAWYIPCNGQLGKSSVLEALKPFIENHQGAFYGHNLKYDVHALANEGIQLRKICFDSILGSYLLNSHSHRHSLDSLCLQLFGKVKTDITELIGKGKKQISMLDVPIDKVCHYCCEDVDYSCRLTERLETDLKERGLDKLLHELELPLMTILSQMERAGIFLDPAVLSTFSLELMERLESCEKAIHDLAGEEFNIKSPKQLGQILFEKLGIAPPKKTATGYSTDASVLETLKADYPIAEKILEFRSLEKLRSTYVDTLPTEILPKTGRIHCQFNQSVAATGRLSSQHPNLQNIPVRTEDGRRIREAFRPQNAGWAYLSADYSQIELRLLAHMSQDPKLLQAFHEGQDIHAYTASLVFDVPIDKVSKEERYRAKAVNFGIIYGQQAFGLSKELQISVGEAKSFIERYFERYPSVKTFIESCHSQARESGRSVTLTGRERSIPDINSKNAILRSAAERLAVNTPLQGTAADIIKMAMLSVDRETQTQNLQGFMILQVHDELIFEVPESELPQWKALVKNCMENVMSLDLPLEVDIRVGNNWKEC